ncbi:ABC transporter permease [Candidatus Saccharibacteria bacterium]|nr:ABC transporter permease [Candidatus Saccharibacteria bacterium]
MKAILTYAWIMLKRFMRDPVYLFFMFAFPLIFLFIFGTIFGNQSSVNFNIAIINHADNDFAKSFVEKFDSDENETFTVNKDVSSMDEAKTKMSRGELDSIIEIPKDFGKISETCHPELVSGSTEYNVDSGRSVRNEPHPATRGFQNDNNINCLPSGQLKVYFDEGSPQAGQTVATIMSGILDEMNAGITGQKPLFTVEQKSAGEAGLSQFDYTFAGLLSYVLMTMGIYALSQQLPSEKKTGSLRRIKATPFKPWQLLTSLALVYLVLTFLSAILMIVVGILVFDFQMRGSWLVLATFATISTLTMIGFGAIVAGAARNENQATMASQLIAFPMMFLGGVFFPRFLMPDWLQNITAWIPLTPVGEGVRYITTEGASLFAVWPQLLMIIGWGLVAYLIAFKVFKWE